MSWDICKQIYTYRHWYGRVICIKNLDCWLRALGYLKMTEIHCRCSTYWADYVHWFKCCPVPEIFFSFFCCLNVLWIAVYKSFSYTIIKYVTVMNCCQHNSNYFILLFCIGCNKWEDGFLYLHESRMFFSKMLVAFLLLTQPHSRNAKPACITIKSQQTEEIWYIDLEKKQNLKLIYYVKLWFRNFDLTGKICIHLKTEPCAYSI